MAPRILIADDDAWILRMVSTVLEKRGYIVETATDGEDAYTRAVRNPPDLVITDVMMPRMDGWSLVRALRARPEMGLLPVIFLTALSSDDDRIRGFRLGADDYVPKPFSPREVVARVQALLRRSAATQAGVRVTRPPTSVGDLDVDHFKLQVRVAGALVALTPTEFRLVEALVMHPGRAFTREELVARAFGPDYDGLDRTVDTHVTNLRRKLGAAAGRALIQTVHGIGYRLEPPSDA